MKEEIIKASMKDSFTGKTQIIICLCGQTIAACLEPECWTDKSWTNQTSKYVKRGYKIEMIDSKELKFGHCICQKKIEPLGLFKNENINEGKTVLKNE